MIKRPPDLDSQNSHTCTFQELYKSPWFHFYLTIFEDCHHCLSNLPVIFSIKMLENGAFSEKIRIFLAFCVTVLVDKKIEWTLTTRFGGWSTYIFIVNIWNKHGVVFFFRLTVTYVITRTTWGRTHVLPSSDRQLKFSGDKHICTTYLYSKQAKEICKLRVY